MFFCWREVEWKSDILGLWTAHLVVHICVHTAPLTGEWNLSSPRCEVGNGFVFDISLEPGSFKAFEKRRNAIKVSQRSGKTILGICLAPTVLMPALSPDFPASILCFLQLLSKRTEMDFLLCFLQRHILLMKPSQTVAYSPEKILFQATDV